jgi:hypothetical protein
MERQEILAEVIAGLRARRLQGAHAAELMRELMNWGMSATLANEHMQIAFGLRSPFEISMISRAAPADQLDRVLEDYVGPKIDAKAAEWSVAPPYPDLMRRRDRNAFREVAKRTNAFLIVCAAPLAAGAYVGKTGYRAFPYQLLGVPRGAPPHEGLIAADPGDGRLETVCRGFGLRGYDDYVAWLRGLGLGVGGKEDGYLVRDGAGTAFYPSYYLHGAYHRENGLTAWTGAAGEEIRRALNERLGEELVPFGPHDDWDGRLRLAPGNPFRGPLPPVIVFSPSGNAGVCADLASMKRDYEFYKIDWSALYPTTDSNP